MSPEIIALARKHFQENDRHFYRHIAGIQIKDFEKPQKTDLYHSIVRVILGQQLSTKAAHTIYQRFLTLFKDSYPWPTRLIKISNEALRAQGVSRQKAGYLRNVAQFFLERQWTTEDVIQMEDDYLIEQLTSIKGVGTWTVQMLLMFTLGRQDILPVDDLGIQKGIKKIYSIEFTGKQLKNEMIRIASSWSPYRTIGCMYLWRFADGGEPIK
ncbi:MAG: DNA-3-methyladenine glycosylase 2 family protein [Bacteroidia bacterium]|nr:DNA-3-methyladenine glycosylase 2 family protein [Bacteroidia bacterium]